MRFMQPVTVSIDVPRDRSSVYAFLDVMANHESFTDHMLREWTCSGPPTGVGARASVINVLGGRRVPVEIEVIDAVDGARTTERNVSAGGRRIGCGTYELTDLARGGTRVTFTYEWQKAPLEDRLLSVVVRPMMRRALQRALDRLAGELGDKVDLAAKLAAIDEHFSPKIVAEINDYKVEVVKARGEFVWHTHPDTDDFFLVLAGRLTIQLRDRDIDLGPGQMFVVPRGTEHCPRADEEAHVLLIEPTGTPNTGDAGGRRTAVEERI